MDHLLEYLPDTGQSITTASLLLRFIVPYVYFFDLVSSEARTECIDPTATEPDYPYTL